MATCAYGGSGCTAVLSSLNTDQWLGIGDPAGHLFDGLAWLLRAAQEWDLQDQLGLEIGGYSPKVYAMDSVFLRARTLYEFFTGKGKNYCHAQCLFNLSNQLQGPVSPRQWRDWKNEIHIGSIHLQDRSQGSQLTSHDGTTTKDLNQMPVDIAKGVLEVWGNFEKALRANSDTVNLNKAEACREKAEEDSRAVIDSVAQRAVGYASHSPGTSFVALF